MRSTRSIGSFVLAALAGCGAPNAPQSANPAPAATKPGAAAETASSGSATPAAQAPARVGTYTSIAPADCRVIERDAESGGSRSLCAGVGGYRIALVESDARMSVDVIPPQGAAVPLRLSTLAGGAFSSLGPRIEWLATDAHFPNALVVRYQAFEFPEQPDRSRSYLVVAKLAPTPCVVAVVEPGVGQNEAARQAADAAAGTNCREP